MPTIFHQSLYYDFGLQMTSSKFSIVFGLLMLQHNTKQAVADATTAIAIDIWNFCRPLNGVVMGGLLGF